MDEDLPAVLAVDGGNSKIDAALVAASGAVLGAARGPGASFLPSDHDASMARLLAVVEAAVRDAGLEGRIDSQPVDEPAAGPETAGRLLARVGAFCLAGDDLPVDDRRLGGSLEETGWVGRVVLRNDTAAVLKAGSRRGWGIAAVCGAGMNCCGLGPDGREVRYPSLGQVSGDQGGGGWLGVQAVGAAVRGADGRGAHTRLEDDVPRSMGKADLGEVLEAVHLGEVAGFPQMLAPVVVAAAAGGDGVAAGLLAAQAGAIVAMVVSAARRLDLLDTDVEVVLAGGLLTAEPSALAEAVCRDVLAAMPAASVAVLCDPPVVGAALLGLEGAAGATLPGHSVWGGGHDRPVLDVGCERVRSELTESRILRAGRRLG